MIYKRNIFNKHNIHIIQHTIYNINVQQPFAYFILLSL